MPEEDKIQPCAQANHLVMKNAYVTATLRGFKGELKQGDEGLKIGEQLGGDVENTNRTSSVWHNILTTEHTTVSAQERKHSTRKTDPYLDDKM